MRDPVRRFAYRLCLELGIWDVDALLETIPDWQLREWAAFFSMEPWGAEIEFVRSGIIASTIVNASPNRKRGSKQATPYDFVPKSIRGEKPVENVKAFIANLKAATSVKS